MVSQGRRSQPGRSPIHRRHALPQRRWREEQSTAGGGVVERDVMYIYWLSSCARINHHGLAPHLIVNGENVLPKNTDEENLDAAEKEQCGNQSGDTCGGMDLSHKREDHHGYRINNTGDRDNEAAQSAARTGAPLKLIMPLSPCSNIRPKLIARFTMLARAPSVFYADGFESRLKCHQSHEGLRIVDAFHCIVNLTID